MADGPEQHPEAYGIGRLFYVIAEAIVGADLSTGCIVLWNPAAEALFGYPPGEAIGRPLDSLVPESLREQHRAGVARFRSGAEPVLVGAAPVVVPALTRDGAIRQVALTLTDASDDGSRRHVVAVLRDVTAQLAAEAELAAANQALRQFVATASHDLRTPLASAMGFASLLADHRGALSEEQRAEAAGAIVRATRHAARLVDDLLTLSQIQADGLAANPTPVELAEAAAEVVAALGADGDGSGPAVELDCPPGVRALVDAHHLRRILENLLTNARRYGKPPVRVAVVRSSSTSVDLRVEDAGDGVPEAFVDRLFTSFARADPARRDGSGLGLSIVKGLAAANGGSAFYDRTPPGCCFGVTLRAAP